MKYILYTIGAIWIILSLGMFYIIFALSGPNGGKIPSPFEFITMLFAVPFVLVPFLVFNLIMLIFFPPRKP